MGVGIIDPSVGVGAFFPSQWKSWWGLDWAIPGSLFGNVIEVVNSPLCIERTAPSSGEVFLCGLLRCRIKNTGEIWKICIDTAGAVYALLESLHWSIKWWILGLRCCRISPSYHFPNRNCFSANLRSELRSIAVRDRIQTQRLVCAGGATDSSTRIAGRLLLHFVSHLECPRIRTGHAIKIA